jgi:hypothetical protein
VARISGGRHLEQRLAELAAKLKKAATLRVGFLEGATYPDGTSVPLVAAVNEYGAPSRGQPPRPFFRGMIRDKSPDWPDQIEALLVASDFDAERALNLMGQQIGGDLRQAIVDFDSVELSKATIRRKGFAKQLIDTTTMLNSIDYQVE